jgi:Na+(H+)/acetate symporter ActP
MTPMFAMAVDPWILAFSAITVGATIFMGFWTARKSKTASDFFVAGRSVSVGWNASAILGEYLSAASFMGIAGMVMSSGYDALWYPVCYACGYLLLLLLFIAGPLRRFGAYTIPDFAEGRFDSPVFRKIAVYFVLFIGFFYTMPQMKGAGTTLSYIFPGLPYWAGVVLVGAVITLNVALGGMKDITLVQAVQYWAKMFAISVPIFVLIIALVCGTAGLPHILVRFYTNPDGVAAKRTTMWVMILIGIFYVFPPVFGVMGRNLFPELYNGIGAKGTDKIVLELPRILNTKYAPLGSILSGITCAGAFAAFMSTFSGLLVSMTGAMAHDVYGRMLRPKSTPNERCGCSRSSPSSSVAWRCCLARSWSRWKSISWSARHLPSRRQAISRCCSWRCGGVNSR